MKRYEVHVTKNYKGQATRVLDETYILITDSPARAIQHARTIANHAVPSNPHIETFVNAPREIEPPFEAHCEGSQQGEHR